MERISQEAARVLVELLFRRLSGWTETSTAGVSAKIRTGYLPNMNLSKI
jgi:hypothetical protein